MESQKDDYDIFIYCEDDLLFTKKNFQYWLNHKDKCIQRNYNLGFLRAEVNKKNKKLYSTDQVEKSQYYVDLSKKKYVIFFQVAEISDKIVGYNEFSYEFCYV